MELTDVQWQAMRKLSQRSGRTEVAGQHIDILEVPAVAGGEGRSGEDVECDGKVIAWLAGFALAGLVAVLVYLALRAYGTTN